MLSNNSSRLASLCVFFLLHSGAAVVVNDCDLFCLFQQEVTRGIPKTQFLKPEKDAPVHRKDTEPDEGVAKIPKKPLRKPAAKPTRTAVPPAQPKPIKVIWPIEKPSLPPSFPAPPLAAGTPPLAEGEVDIFTDPSPQPSVSPPSSTEQPTPAETPASPPPSPAAIPRPPGPFMPFWPPPHPPGGNMTSTPPAESPAPLAPLPEEQSTTMAPPAQSPATPPSFPFWPFPGFRPPFFPPQPSADGDPTNTTGVPQANPLQGPWQPFFPSQPSADGDPTSSTGVPPANPWRGFWPPFFPPQSNGEPGTTGVPPVNPLRPGFRAHPRRPLRRRAPSAQPSPEPTSTVQPDDTLANPPPDVEPPVPNEQDPVASYQDEGLYNITLAELELSNLKLKMKEMDEKMAVMSASMKKTKLEDEFMSSEIWFASNNRGLLEQAEQQQLKNQEGELTTSYQALKSRMEQLQNKLGALTKEISERQIAYETMTRELKQIQIEHAEISKQLATGAEENQMK